MTILSFIASAPGSDRPGRVVLLGNKTRLAVDDSLGDTNFELGMPPVDPKRENMDDPGFDRPLQGTEQVPVQARARLFQRTALVELHTTPPVGAPREDLRSHLDEGIKDQMKTDVGNAGPDTDPDLKREGRPIGGHR